MDDYYKILNVNNNSTKEEIKFEYNKLIDNYKILPFISENDKTIIKLIKKAYYVLTHDEYKKTYDTNLLLKQNQLSILPQPNVINKKGNVNNSYIADRIFSFNDVIINKKIYNIDDSEFLRPKSVGLGSDVKPDFDTPLDFDPTIIHDVVPFDNDN
jgi:DnaJ-class molecular chaperone